eukprot:1832248-Alexandrium_andersonii.AAC.1
MRVNIAQGMLEEYGDAAGCSKCSRARERRPAAGAQRSEECRSRFKSILRATGDANTARVDERVNERLSREAQSRVEAGAAVVPRPEAA